MLLLCVGFVFAVPILIGLFVLALIVEFGMKKPSYNEVEVVEEEPELDLDKIVRDLLANETRKPLYRSWTKAGYSMELGK